MAPLVDPAAEESPKAAAAAERAKRDAASEGMASFAQMLRYASGTVRLHALGALARERGESLRGDCLFKKRILLSSSLDACSAQQTVAA